MSGCRRGEIELCARLLGVAAAALNENPGLLGFVVLAKFALLTVMLPLMAFSGLAYTNGDLVPNSKPRLQVVINSCNCCFGAMQQSPLFGPRHGRKEWLALHDLILVRANPA